MTTFCIHGVEIEGLRPSRCLRCEAQARIEIANDPARALARIEELEPLADELLRLQAVAWVAFAPVGPTPAAKVFDARNRMNAHLRDLALRCIPIGRKPAPESEPEPVSSSETRSPDDPDCPF
jgi:hypothetical protein